MSLDVKICGITDPEALAAAHNTGASHAGFVFFAKSPRAITAKRAAALANDIPQGLKLVGLFVDPDDSLLEATLATIELDAIQLHGDESPARVREVKALTQKQVWKVIPIGSESDVSAAHAYEDVADFLLFDAKPPKSMPLALQGGNGLAFDWQLIAGETWSVPWILAGGLTANNVSEAISTSRASFVDVSSGVEDAPGIKSPAKIQAFVTAALNTSL
ncbi:MAG: phosphoribosylanthranilate isomerase [Proteobacteria bacterium]|nr:phosphoribosylanthranilate isomerase [Pseudomonadota bacterium]